MKLHCPHCGVTGTADDSYVGRTVKCPKCQGMFEAGATPESSELKQEKISGEKVTLSCPKCGVEGAAGDSFVGRRVKCPQCQEMFLVQFDETSGKVVGAVLAPVTPPVEEPFAPPDEVSKPYVEEVAEVPEDEPEVQTDLEIEQESGLAQESLSEVRAPRVQLAVPSVKKISEDVQLQLEPEAENLEAEDVPELQEAEVTEVPEDEPEVQADQEVEQEAEFTQESLREVRGPRIQLAVPSVKKRSEDMQLQLEPEAENLEAEDVPELQEAEVTEVPEDEPEVQTDQEVEQEAELAQESLREVRGPRIQLAVPSVKKRSEDVPLQLEPEAEKLEAEDVLELQEAEVTELIDEDDEEVLIEAVELTEEALEELPGEEVEEPVELELEEESEQVLDEEDQAPASEEHDESGAEDELDYVQQEPYGVAAEQCWQCGKESADDGFIPRDGRLYCSDCIPDKEEIFDPTDPDGLGVAEAAAAAAGIGLGTEVAAGATGTAQSMEEPVKENGAMLGEFTIPGMLKDAWELTKGAKGVIWRGSAVMYLVIFALISIGKMLFPGGEGEVPTVTGTFGNAIFQAVIDAVSVIFTAGLIYLGIRRVAGDHISWKMVFKGFSSCTGKIIVATILQSILVTIGFLLLIIPGIYLTVGYAMTLPLIVEEGMSPWEAMETSRKAIHKVWWKIAGLLGLMGLITLVATIPAGVGLIWVWPMFIILAGVVYKHLFGKGSGL